MGLKIALVSPYYLFLECFRLSEDAEINAFLAEKARFHRAYSPSDSLLQIAAITPPEHKLVYMDDQFANINTHADIDIAAFTVTTISAPRAYKLAQKFKKNGIYTIMGGVHPTFCPDEAKKFADTIVIGDADIAWRQFLKDFEKGKPKKVYEQGCVADIKNLPKPKIGLLSKKWYYRKIFNKEAYTIFTTFGCNRFCKFCVNCLKPGYGKIHKKKLSQIEAEIQQVAAYSNNFIIIFCDDNCFIDLDHMSDIIKMLTRMKIRWVAPGDIAVANHPKVLKLIEKSDCALLCVGFESIKKENLKWVAPWKAKFIDTYKERIGIFRDYGINITGSFIAGFEHDTDSVFREIFDFSMESKLTTTVVGIATPYPGTPFRDDLIQKGLLNKKAGWDMYTGMNLLYKHPKIEKQKLYSELLWFLKEVEKPYVQNHLNSITFR